MGCALWVVDQFSPPHDRGSSHGQTRVIRQSYFEHPDYVPLVLESYRLWNELEQLVEKKLYHETGLLEVGPPNGIVIPGLQLAAQKYDLEIEPITARDIAARWPGISVPDELTGMFEQRAGYLRVEECVASHLAMAERFGAELRTDCEVTGWKATPKEVVVQTRTEKLVAKKLIVTAGAWSGALLRELGVGLQVLRKSIFWFRCDESSYTEESGMPTFLFELPSRIFYGFHQSKRDASRLLSTAVETSWIIHWN